MGRRTVVQLVTKQPVKTGFRIWQKQPEICGQVESGGDDKDGPEQQAKENNRFCQRRIQDWSDLFHENIGKLQRGDITIRLNCNNFCNFRAGSRKIQSLNMLLDVRLLWGQTQFPFLPDS